jgi:hypothetical protein
MDSMKDLIYLLHVVANAKCRSFRFMGPVLGSEGWGQPRMPNIQYIMTNPGVWWREKTDDRPDMSVCLFNGRPQSSVTWRA